MKLTFESHGVAWAVDLRRAYSLAIPIKFDKKLDLPFGAPTPTKRAYEAGGFVGDTQRGGSCNCEELHVMPHCQGTHTEIVGHITKERVSHLECDIQPFLLACVISVETVLRSSVTDMYSEHSKPQDQVISRAGLEKNWRDVPGCEALIVRTLPDTGDKLNFKYRSEPPPYFTTDAMMWMREKNMNHILFDGPSMDRTDDGGLLLNHRVFWDTPDAKKKSITELIYVPNDLADGIYFLNLQLPKIQSDAVPSNPVIYPVKKVV